MKVVLAYAGAAACAIAGLAAAAGGYIIPAVACLAVGTVLTVGAATRSTS